MRTGPGLVIVLSLSLVCGCASQTGGAGWTYAPPSLTPAPSASGSPGASGSPATSGSPAASASAGASGAANTIELEETADLQIKQAGQKVAQLQVKQGQPYTFRITNSANLAHDFYIGTEQDLKAGNKQNAKGIPDFNSGTQEFQYTFQSGGPLQFACLVAGHYATMHGDFVIQP